MCSTNNTGSALLPYGIKIPNPTPYGAAVAAAAAVSMHPGMTQAAFDLHRAHLYDYNVRLQQYGLQGLRGYPGIHGLPGFPHPQDPLAHAYLYKQDPRMRFIHEEPKPSHSYIGLIAMAILSHKDKKLVLSDIYQWILDNYNYFRTRGPGWRNSIRHNLSLNDCFIKSGRSANGKGHYWAIHPANIEDFKKGDFRRRRAQRRVRKHMGLAVPDDEDSPSPPPTTSSDILEWRRKLLEAENELSPVNETKTLSSPEDREINSKSPHIIDPVSPPSGGNPTGSVAKKRLFDVESLLAPEKQTKFAKKDNEEEINSENISKDNDCDADSLIEVGSEHEPIDMRQEKELNTSSEQGSNCGSPFEKSEQSHPSSPVPSSSAEGPSTGRVFPGPFMGLPTPWPDHPSAFHSATPATATAWATLPPHGYPIMSAPFPMPGSAPGGSAMESAQRWQEAFARIMSRSYDKNLKLEV